ncbi:MAG: DMT family transporter [Nostocaceae cyanobacterium CSU_2_110]|nr:DMT family transporter [Nostocaceae cyanobacterium CSU_2_110]
MIKDEHKGIIYAILAVFVFSTTAVLTRWAEPLSAYEIATGRLGVATLIVMIVARLSGQPLVPSRKDLLSFIAFGLVTALHFLLYIASLSLTTIAHALSLIYTAPIFITIASAWFLNEPIPRSKWLGVILSVVGIAILAGFEPQFNSRMLMGDILAVGSAVMYALYSVAGRSQKARYPLLTYAGIVYGLGTLWALPVAIINFQPAGYGWRQIGSIIVLGALPLALGHTLYNAALRLVHATYINIISAQEVTLGVILGVLFSKKYQI